MKSRILIFTILTVIVVAVFVSCAKAELTEYSFFAFDTFNYIKAGDVDVTILRECEDECSLISSVLSCHDPDSELSRLNDSLSASVSDRLCYVLGRSLYVYNLTNGSFDPSIGTLISLWNIGGDSFSPPPDDSVSEILGNHRIFEIDGKQAVLPNHFSHIDLGAIAKGYALDIISEKLKDEGSHSFLISLGGNISVWSDGSRSFRIGVKNPEGDGIVGVLNLTEGFVSVSGSYERFSIYRGDRYSHIINPSDGYPVKGDLASTVIVSREGALGDALSTATICMGADEAIAFYSKYSDELGIEMILIYNDGTLYVTDGLKDIFEYVQ